MEKAEIKNKFVTEGFDISNQALEILTKLDNVDYHIRHILKQLKERKMIVAGGDLMKYIITGKIGDTISVSQDVR